MKEPVYKRAAIFVDGQNLFHSVKINRRMYRRCIDSRDYRLGNV